MNNFQSSFSGNWFNFSKIPAKYSETKCGTAAISISWNGIWAVRLSFECSWYAPRRPHGQNISSFALPCFGEERRQLTPLYTWSFVGGGKCQVRFGRYGFVAFLLQGLFAAYHTLWLSVMLGVGSERQNFSTFCPSFQTWKFDWGRIDQTTSDVKIWLFVFIHFPSTSWEGCFRYA